jgi:CRP/FNR family transcriptional regulator, nitrogen oxide reductase regulator
VNALALKQTTPMVQGFSLFAELSPSDCATIVSSAREKAFARKQTIFSEGDPVEQVIMLLSGCVKVSQIGVNGNEVILRLNGAGEIVGAFRMCSRCNHCSTATAVQPSVALVWDPIEFERLLGRFPALRRNTVFLLEERLREMEQRFREVSTEKVHCRLSGELLRLCRRLGRDGDSLLEITLSRAELAQLTGTTLFTVSRLLCQWQSMGIVKIRREAVLVQDFAALTQLSESE